jgi:hypothetical protein
VQSYIQRTQVALQNMQGGAAAVRREREFDDDDEGSWHGDRYYEEYGEEYYDEYSDEYGDEEGWDDESDFLLTDETQEELLAIANDLAELTRQSSSQEVLAVLAAIVPMIISDPGLSELAESARAYGLDISRWTGYWQAFDQIAAQALLMVDPDTALANQWTLLATGWAEQLAAVGLPGRFPLTLLMAKLAGWGRGRLVDNLAKADLPQSSWYMILDTLDRRGEVDAYLAVARRYTPVQYAQRMTALGRVEELANDRDLAATDGPTLLTIAQQVEQTGAIPAALQLGRLALQKPGPHRADGAIWLRDLALQAGDHGLAVDAAMLGVLERPRLDEYRRLKSLAGEAWPELQPDILAALRQSVGHSVGVAPYAVIEIMLEEDNIEEALALVARFPNRYMFQTVQQAALERAPDILMRYALESAQEVLGRGHHKYYEEAVEYLQLARTAAQRAGRETEWDSALAQIRQQHARKRLFIQLLATFD